MQEILNFFTWLQETLTSVIEFLIDFVEGLISIISLTATFVVMVPSYLSWLPSQVLSIIVVAFGIVVIYKISGREG